MRFSFGFRIRNFMVAALLGTAPLPAAADDASLYAATTIVTGRDNLAERARGTREALAEVLMKLTADRGIAEDPKAMAAIENAEDFAAGFDYTDRKAGIQLSDEQGSRDRSFLLDVRFDAARVDALLAELGAKPWKGERPTVKVELSVTDGVGSFEVTDTSERGYGQRQALRTEAERAGLPLVLPDDPGAEGGSEAGAVLFGRMTVTPQGHWDTVWTLAKGKLDKSWTVKDATFDRAIAEGIWRTAAELKALGG